MKEKIKKVSAQPFVSIALVSINVMVFMACAMFGDYLYTAGYVGIQGVLLDKEYGRLIWGMFLHGDVNHLFSNMILLLFMGSMLEKAIGHLSYCLVYFVSGICGNLLSLLVRMLQSDWSVSIGASGAIFGLDGLLLVVVLMLRHRMKDITPARVGIMIVLSLYSGFSGAAVDNVAHVGGLLVGIVMGFAICLIKKYYEPVIKEESDEWLDDEYDN